MIDSILDGLLRYISKFLSSFLNPKKFSKVFRLINAIFVSKSDNPLLKIELTTKVCCLGKLPIIVSIPEGYIIYILSPTFKFKLKLSSSPIDIKLSVNWF